MFSPAGIIIYKGTSYPEMWVADGSLCANAQDDDLHSPWIPDYEKGRVPTSIRKRSRLYLSGEFIYSVHG